MTGIIIFIITYALISARRLDWLGLDRPAGALLGAVAMVASGVLAPEAALASVDSHTLLLLFGVMGLGGFLAAEGFFERAEAALASRCRTPAGLLGAIVWGAGVLAAFITNDAVCVLGAPVVVALVIRHRLPPLPFLLALATAANTGSVATVVGNPQNMLCANLGGLTYRGYLLDMAPVAVIGLAVNHLVLWLLFRRRLVGTLTDPAADTPPVLTGGSTVILGVTIITAALYTAGADLAWTATGACAALFVLRRGETARIWRHIDWSVLVFFAGLFVVVEGFRQAGGPQWFFARFPLWSGEGPLAWARLTAVFLVGSNVVSNVPFILVVKDAMASVPDPHRAWTLLAMASTFAGNLTFLGSVANVIVAEKGREVGGFGFFSYLAAGFPIALLTTVIGAAWLFWIG